MSSADLLSLLPPSVDASVHEELAEPLFGASDELHIDLDSLLPTILNLVLPTSIALPLVEISTHVALVMRFLSSLQMRIADQRAAASNSLLSASSGMGLVKLHVYMSWGVNCEWTSWRRRHMSSCGADDTHLFFLELTRVLYDSNYKIVPSDGVSAGYAAASAVISESRRRAKRCLQSSAAKSSCESFDTARHWVISDRDEALWYGVDVLRQVVPWALNLRSGIRCFRPSMLSAVLFSHFSVDGAAACDASMLSQLGVVLAPVSRQVLTAQRVLQLAQIIAEENSSTFTHTMLRRLRLVLPECHELDNLQTIHARHMMLSPWNSFASGAANGLVKTSPLVVNGVDKGLCGAWPHSVLERFSFQVPPLERIDSTFDERMLSDSETLLWSALTGCCGGAILVEGTDDRAPIPTEVQQLATRSTIQGIGGTNAILSVNGVWPLNRDTDSLKSMLPFLRICDARDGSVSVSLQLHHIDGIARVEPMFRLTVLTILLLRLGKYFTKKWEWSMVLAAAVASKSTTTPPTFRHITNFPNERAGCSRGALEMIRRSAALFCRVLTHLSLVNDLFHQAMTLCRDRRAAVSLAALAPIVEDLASRSASDANGGRSEGADEQSSVLEDWYEHECASCGVYGVWLSLDHMCAHDYALCHRFVADCAQ